MLLGQVLFQLADNRAPRSLSSRFRNDRFRKFAAMLHGASRTPSILDVGGTTQFWLRHRDKLPMNTSVTLLNSDFGELPDLPGISYVEGDARDIAMFADEQFDVCFSNSVIEHVGTLDDQLKMALEDRRVARGYFVQTANLYLPLEPHFLVLGWQFAPLSLRTRLLQRRDLGWMKRIEDPRLARAAVESIRLLTIREMRRLF